MKYRLELHPLVALALIALAIIGIDACWSQQRKMQRRAATTAKPAATRVPPPAATAHHQPFPSRQPTPPAAPIIGKIGKRPPGGARQSAQQRIIDMDQAVTNAAIKGAVDYVQQRQ